MMAARTRSRASLTSVSGRPTSVKLGNPLAKWASTTTGGAFRPSSPRLCAMASAMLLTGARLFECVDAGFQGLQLFAGAGQHLCLDVEFLTGHQIELGEHAAQD